MAGMGHLEVAHLEYYLPDGRRCCSATSASGWGRATSWRWSARTARARRRCSLASGELKPHAGTVTISGGLGVMRQFVGSVRDERTVRDLLVSVARPPVRAAAHAVDAAEHAIMTATTRPPSWPTRRRSPTGPRPAATRPRPSGTCARWPRSASRTTRRSGARCAPCPAASRSVWCSRRCCAAPTRCCCSTSRTTTSTSPASAGWRSSSNETRKTVLFVSHDRELLARAAPSDRHASSRAPAAPTPGCTAAASPRTTRPASERFARFEELRRRWDEKHAQLKKLVLNLRQAAVRQP